LNNAKITRNNFAAIAFNRLAIKKAIAFFAIAPMF
jgi:hypothetical protein